jgi:hypothetical protein
MRMVRSPARGGPRVIALEMESCGRPGTDYDDEARVVTIAQVFQMGRRATGAGFRDRGGRHRP